MPASMADAHVQDQTGDGLASVEEIVGYFDAFDARQVCVPESSPNCFSAILVVA